MICQTKIEISALFLRGVFQWHGVAWHFNMGGFFLIPSAACLQRFPVGVAV